MRLDIAAILAEELETDRSNFRAFQTYLNYLAGKKISREHSVQSFIYSFENLMWEKLFCVAFREFSPETVIIGYAHSTISSMETFYAVSSFEKPFLPLPDIIAVNGSRARDALVNSGFNREQVIVGGAYRYHTLDISPRPRKDAGNNNTILIIPTDDFDSTLELVTKTVQAFGNKKGTNCIIKLHPTLPRKKISAYLSGIPENFSISEEPIERLLVCTDLVVYTGSTVAIEAMARGIPILHVRSDLIIDRDIFNERDHIVSVSKPEEMYRASMSILSMDNESMRAGSDFVREFFEPVNSDVLQVFLAHKH
jgi:surface carbohydrate biosynthesis protein (TIGR04326 family)